MLPARGHLSLGLQPCPYSRRQEANDLVLGHLELAFWPRAGGRFCLLLASPALALWISKNVKDKNVNPANRPANTEQNVFKINTFNTDDSSASLPTFLGSLWHANMCCLNITWGWAEG